MYWMHSLRGFFKIIRIRIRIRIILSRCVGGGGGREDEKGER